VLITRPSESTTDWLKLKPFKLNAIVLIPIAVIQIPTTGHKAKKKCKARELWVRSSSGSGVASPGVFRVGRSGEMSPPRPDPREVVLPFGANAASRSRYLVHDSRLVVSTTSRSSGMWAADAGAPTAPMGLDSSSGSPIRPGRFPQEPAPLMRFCAPTATRAWRSTDPGVQPGSFRLQVFSTS
jgi:hypothetical protein